MIEEFTVRCGYVMDGKAIVTHERKIKEQDAGAALLQLSVGELDSMLSFERGDYNIKTLEAVAL